MKAYRVVPGQDIAGLERVDLASGPLGPLEVRVRVRAVSLNYRDLMVVRGHYPVGSDRPMVPVSDGAGEVLEVGSAVQRFQPGDRVVTTFFQGWQAGERPAGVAQTALGGRIDGVLAEEVVLSENGLLPVPESLDFLQAATLPVAAVTAWTSLFVHGRARAGDSVLLLGTGGVSVWALQLAKAAGLHVLLTSSSDAKLARARTLGADELINYRDNPEWQDEVLRRTGGRGVDLVLEVGGAGTLERSVAATRDGGAVALIGVLAGLGRAFDPLPILFGGKRLEGVLVGNAEHQQQLQRFLTMTRIEPVIDRVFGFDEVPQAFACLASGGHFGKVVVRLD
ncbi:NAD(P)-dependent alcohol dehydrogenase [Aquabacterium sp. A7-Y]|uniref:zinc-dependent alcohol dehydrogenase family protein n=1 Tax=Aquabacterium sp. A7-Y TaxID=1349605 RepID=UPI00223D3FC1|nr:NAD(P)-dependent alcohol dehydrogenase [Aquabacterium sp. A7-Y]MCW7538441.1 NAD(P)-dependent alcohol dehydrogenase [Aquabacterium sp. A7-Y]